MCKCCAVMTASLTHGAEGGAHYKSDHCDSHRRTEASSSLYPLPPRSPHLPIDRGQHPGRVHLYGSLNLSLWTLLFCLFSIPLPAVAGAAVLYGHVSWLRKHAAGISEHLGRMMADYQSSMGHVAGMLELQVCA